MAVASMVPSRYAFTPDAAEAPAGSAGLVTFTSVVPGSALAPLAVPAVSPSAVRTAAAVVASTFTSLGSPVVEIGPRQTSAAGGVEKELDFRANHAFVAHLDYLDAILAQIVRCPRRYNGVCRVVGCNGAAGGADPHAAATLATDRSSGGRPDRARRRAPERASGVARAG